MSKERILHITKDDCDWEYFRGSGAGGQKRNKTSNAVRCRHRASGAIGVSKDGRSQLQNRQVAFRHMFESKEFQAWLKIEVARRMGTLLDIDKWVEKEMKNIKVQVRNKQGELVEVPADMNLPD